MSTWSTWSTWSSITRCPPYFEEFILGLVLGGDVDMIQSLVYVMQMPDVIPKMSCFFWSKWETVLRMSYLPVEMSVLFPLSSITTTSGVPTIKTQRPMSTLSRPWTIFGRRRFDAQYEPCQLPVMPPFADDFPLGQDFDWSNLLLAGGFLSRSFKWINNTLCVRKKSNSLAAETDIDLFIYGLTQEVQVIALTQRLRSYLRQRYPSSMLLCVSKTDSVVNIFCGEWSIQLIASGALSIHEVVLNFDMAHCGWAFDGKTLMTTWSALQSLQTNETWYVGGQTSVSFRRLWKPTTHGYNVIARAGDPEYQVFIKDEDDIMHKRLNESLDKDPDINPGKTSKRYFTEGDRQKQQQKQPPDSGGGVLIPFKDISSRWYEFASELNSTFDPFDKFRPDLMMDHQFIKTQGDNATKVLQYVFKYPVNVYGVVPSLSKLPLEWGYIGHVEPEEIDNVRPVFYQMTPKLVVDGGAMSTFTLVYGPWLDIVDVDSVTGRIRLVLSPTEHACHADFIRWFRDIVSTTSEEDIRIGLSGLLSMLGQANAPNPINTIEEEALTSVRLYQNLPFIDICPTTIKIRHAHSRQILSSLPLPCSTVKRCYRPLIKLNPRSTTGLFVIASILSVEVFDWTVAKTIE